jgi:acetyl-CoA C-acetyltransferase
MHGIATVVGDLRSRPGAHGLVWANGGYVTKHSFGVYNTNPPANGTRLDDHAIQAEIDALPNVALAEAPDAAGPATIEAYTVMHSREGVPELVIAACLTPDGRRAWGTSIDPVTAAAVTQGEWVGRAVTLDAEGALEPV